MNRIAWGSFFVGVVATFAVMYFLKGRKKAAA